MKYLLGLVAIASTYFVMPAAQAEMACYMEMENRQVDLTAVCDGSQSQSAIAIPEFQPGLVVYGMQNAQVWHDRQWQRSQHVSMRMVNLGDAAANNVTLTVRGERHGDAGQVEQVEFRTITIDQVPARVTGNVTVEFSFIPDNCQVTAMVWN